MSVALKLEEALLSGPHPIWHQEPVFMLDSCSTHQGWGGFGVTQAYFFIHFIAIIITSALPHIIQH